MTLSVEQLIYSVEYLDPHTPVETVLATFNRSPVKSLVVVRDDQTPVGFISKDRLAVMLAQKYGYALYQNKPALSVMETEFLKTDEQTDVLEIVTAAVQRDPERVYDDIVVTQKGLFKGVISIQNLIVAQMNHIIKQRQTLTFQDQSLKETQYLFERSEIKYRYLFDYSLNALAVIDQQGVITRCNQRFEKLFRMEKEEIEGKLAFIDLIHHDDRADIIQNFLVAQKNSFFAKSNGETHASKEIRFVTKHKESRIADFAVYYLPQLQQFIVSLNDVTDKKIFEVKYRQSEKLSAVGTLLAGITHELNNQLTPVLAYVDMIIESAQTIDEKTLQRLELIKKSANTAASIVGSLLRYSKPKPLILKYSNLNRLIRDNLALIKYHAQYKNTDIHLELSDPLPDCQIDENQIGQVLLNLFINALQAMEGKAGRLKIRTWRENQYIGVEVADNGIGIPPEIAGKIFDPFFTTKEPGKGTGLGLSISYSIIKSHSGEISVRSEPGKGSAFTILLPVYPGETADNDPRATDERQKIKPLPCPKKILIVEDDPLVSRLTKEIMSEYFACDIRLAENGQRAIEMLKTDNHYDLILSDIRMPVMDGLDFHQWITQARQDLTEKFIFITGDTYDQRVNDYISLHQVAVLHKPFSIEHILDKLKDKNIF